VTKFSRKLFDVHEYPIKSDKLVFVFTAMGTRFWAYRWFVWRLNRRGYSVILYDYSTETVLNPTLAKWQDFFRKITIDAQSRLAKYQKLGATNFYSYGVSMGTLLANYFARQTREIHHVILNLTYGDVATNIFTCKLVKRARENFEKQDVNEKTLRENIKYMNPPDSAAGLKNKKVLLYLARHDRKILAFDQARETLKSFREADLDLTYVENRHFGHYVNGIKNLINVAKTDKFFRGQK